MTSSESEGQPPPRKRSRTSAKDDDLSNKKARGRPRVDTQDATAADRRRTQIRLAQRAYRQRKETTISSLKQENAQLQSIIEQMNKSFLRFNDSVLKSGLLQLNASLAQDLKNVTETFVTLARTAAAAGSQEPDEEVPQPADNEAEIFSAHAATTAAREARAAEKRSLAVPQHTDIGWGYSTTMETTASPRYSASPERPIYSDSFLDDSLYDVSKQRSDIVRSRPRMMTVGSVMDQSRLLRDPLNTQDDLPFGLVDILMRNASPYQHHTQTFHADIPTPEVTPPSTRLSTPPLLTSLSTKQLVPNWTYSHDETTFARRLTRASLETGFHLLSNANLRPAALNYVFRLSLPYLSLDTLRERFKILLARGTDEDLDFWETPFIHLGGAGTHYPRKDAQGNITPIPNSWTIRSIGPLPANRIRAENTADPSKSHDIQIDLAGFEGEWFDAHDVQGYLEEEKGVHINPKDSFAEVMVDIEDEDQSSAHGSSLTFLKAPGMDLDFSSLRRTSAESHSDSPSLSNGTSSADSISTRSTPAGKTTREHVFKQSEPYGLDMGFNSLNDLNKLSDFDAAAMFDQPLGLDLAPMFDHNVNTGMGGFSSASFGGTTASFGDMSNMGLDIMGMGADSDIPLIKPKKRKAAFLDVSKLIDEIIKHGVCLGRAPGFRRKDVDLAFQASLVHAY